MSRITKRFFSFWTRNYAEGDLRQLWADRKCTVWAVSRRHAASDTTAVRSALLMGGWRGSGVDIAVGAPGTSSSVGRALGDRDVEGRRCSFFVLKK